MPGVVGMKFLSFLYCPIVTVGGFTKALTDIRRGITRAGGGTGFSVVRNRLDPSCETEYLLLISIFVWLATWVVDVTLPLGPPNMLPSKPPPRPISTLKVESNSNPESTLTSLSIVVFSWILTSIG